MSLQLEQMMSTQFSLFLGDEEIPVVHWINRQGSPEGRKLRFTVPVEAKARLEANAKKTFTLRRGDKKWDFELISVGLNTTGTNGLSAVGMVRGKLPKHLKNKLKSMVEKSSASLSEASSSEAREAGDRPSTGVNLPKLGGTLSEGSLAAKPLPDRKRSETAAGTPTSEVEEVEEEVQLAQPPTEKPLRANEEEPPKAPETGPEEAKEMLDEQE